MLLFIYIPKRRKCFGLLIRLIFLSTVFTISSNILQRPYFFYKKKKILPWKRKMVIYTQFKKINMMQSTQYWFFFFLPCVKLKKGNYRTELTMRCLRSFRLVMKKINAKDWLCCVFKRTLLSLTNFSEFAKRYLHYTIQEFIC